MSNRRTRIIIKLTAAESDVVTSFANQVGMTVLEVARRSLFTSIQNTYENAQKKYEEHLAQQQEQQEQQQEQGVPTNAESEIGDTSRDPGEGVQSLGDNHSDVRPDQDDASSDRD